MYINITSKNWFLLIYRGYIFILYSYKTYIKVVRYAESRAQNSYLIYIQYPQKILDIDLSVLHFVDIKECQILKGDPVEQLNKLII